MDWPIVVDETVRNQLIERVRSRRGRVQLISGPSGIGKSTLAASVAAQLETTGHSILRIVAMPELRDVPLGAMASLLATTGAAISDSTSERLQRLFSLVSPGDAKQVLVVDDGPMLDDISASTVYQLVRLHGVRCVMTARTEHPLSGPLLRLSDEGFIDTTELNGLDLSVSRRIVRAAFGWPVQPESLRAIVTLSGGNPLFLRELVLAATRSGRVRHGDTGIVVDASALPPHLRATIAQRFDGLKAAERNLAEMIALAEPWPENLLPTPELIDDLDRAGLVARAPDGEVYLSHPLFAETLINLMTVEAREERRIDAARRLLGGTRDDHRFKAICLLAETSDPLKAEDLAWAARSAFRVNDHLLAVRLSTRSLERASTLGKKPPFDAFVTRADALSISGQHREAEEAYVVAAGAAVTDEAKANVASRWGFHFALRLQRPRDAIRLGTEVIASLTDPSASAFLAANIAKWRLMVGDAPELAPSETADAADAVTTLNGEIFRVTAAVFAGNLDVARVTIASGRRNAETAPAVSRHAVDLLNFAEFFVIALDGHVDAALEFAERNRGDLFEETVGMWNFGLALFTLHSGKVDAALDLATSAVEQLAWRDILGARGAATALRATAAAQLGQQRLAHDILDSIGPDASVYVATQLQAAEAEAWMLALAGNDQGAIAVIQQAVARGIDSRYHAIAALAAYVPVRLGHAEPVLEQLRAIAAATSAELIVALLAHAEALVARDIPALLAAAEKLTMVGFRAGAVDAARQAAAIARERGMEKTARRASLVAKAWDEGLSGMRHHEADDPAFTLSQREWMVASAAAGRERNREIAGRLGLSERTIENHLTNIYRKLGVTGRDELRRELDALDQDSLSAG